MHCVVMVEIAREIVPCKVAVIVVGVVAFGYLQIKSRIKIAEQPSPILWSVIH